MKIFKHISYSSVLVAGIILMILANSCKSKCGSTVCQNGGSCVDNKCSCATGYSGNSCSSAWDDIIIGTYSCTRSDCHPQVINSPSWTSAITKASTNGGYTINIADFNGSTSSVEATVDSFRNISILNTNGVGIAGSGSYDSALSTMSLVFTATDTGSGTGYTCHMTLVKQN